MQVLQFCLGMVQTNSYIVYDEKSGEAVIIDPAADAPRILQTVQDNQLTLKYILLTHAHFDHILGVHGILQQTDAQYVVPRGDLWLLDPNRMGQFRAMAQGYVPDTPDLIADEGTSVQFGDLTATYLHTPGHTPGSSVIQIGNLLLTGDTLFRHECGRCDLEGGDFSLMLRSLRRLYELEGDYHILPGHEALSTLSEERQYNPYMLQALGQ